MTFALCPADVLSGYNATIFAYGQTSSGKTFTMEVCGYGGMWALRYVGIVTWSNCLRCQTDSCTRRVQWLCKGVLVPLFRTQSQFRTQRV